MRITGTALTVPRMSAIKPFKKEQPGKNEPSQPADLAAACLGGNFLASSAGGSVRCANQKSKSGMPAKFCRDRENHAANNPDHLVGAFSFWVRCPVGRIVR